MRNLELEIYSTIAELKNKKINQKLENNNYRTDSDIMSLSNEPKTLL